MGHCISCAQSYVAYTVSKFGCATQIGLIPKSFKPILVSTVVIGSASAAWWYMKQRIKIPKSENYAVFITGCDSGLGYSFAVHAFDIGLTVFAGCLNLESEGAQKLGKLDPNRMMRFCLDITNEEMISNVISEITVILERKPNLELKALVNNAGVMIFGEFEWLTSDLMKKMVDVNLLGTFKVTKAFCPLIRQYSGRIININSHCSKATLPCLAIYGATKSGLQGWNDAIRIEQKKYGVSVISFIPGSVFMSSNILARQLTYDAEMKSAMAPDIWHFHEEYFQKCQQYMTALYNTHTPEKINNNKLHRQFEHALLAKYPYNEYVTAPMRYTIYHFLFKVTPTWCRDRLIEKFVTLPVWTPKKKISIEE